jgi:hypothetical protein
MKGKTTVTALLFALSLSPMWVMAEGDFKTLPLPQKQACADSETSVWCTGPLPLPRKAACADSETSVWCAGASDYSGAVEERYPLANAMNQRSTSDYFYGSEFVEGSDK